MTTKPGAKARRSAAAGANTLITAGALAATLAGWGLLARDQPLAAEAPADTSALVSAPVQDSGIATLPTSVPQSSVPVAAPAVPATAQPLRRVAPVPLARTRSSR
ncbi:MAG: hypothetical protein OHK0022_32730 [Roseiflexaceae bacterium]